MFHQELFSSSIATGANTFGQVTFFTPDNVLQKLVNGMQVSTSLPYLLAVFGVGAHMVDVRAQSPSMLPFPYPNLNPNNRGTAFESPVRGWDFSLAPIPLKPTEEFDIFASQNATGAETEYVGCLFSDGQTSPLTVPLNPPGVIQNGLTPGRFFTAHSSTSVTVTAGAFSLVSLSLDQALPAGMYALIGARAFSATGLFFRMFPQNSPLWRPGGIAVQAYDSLDPPNQRGVRNGVPALSSWGVWLTFYQNTVPQIEFFCTAADTAQEAWLDLVYLGPQTSQGM